MMDSTQTGKRLRMFRANALLGSVLIVGLYAFRKETHFDPIFLRLGVAAVYFAAFVLSFVSSRAREHMEGLIQICLAITAVWVGYLTHFNHFGHVFVIGYMLLSFSSILNFQTRIGIILFASLSVGVLLLASFGVENAEFDIPTAIVLNTGIMISAIFSVHFRLLGQTELRHGLNKSELIQEVALESSRDAILLVDENGVLRKGNASFREMWEVPGRWIIENRQADVLRHCMDRVQDPEQFRTYVMGGKDTIREGEVLEVEMKGGQVLELYWMRLRMQEQEIGRLWIFRDISARKRIEEGLKASERRLRQNNERLMEFAGSSALRTGDLDTAFSDIARASAEMLGVETVSIWTFDEEYKMITCRKLYRRSTDAYESGVKVYLEKYPGYLEALQQNRALIVGDTREDPLTASFYEGNYTGRAAALIHAQIRSEGKMVGVICLESSTGPRVWTVEDQTYVYSMVDLVSVSIEANERRRVQLQLQKSVAILKAIFDLSETGIIVEDNDHNVLNYNELYLNIWNMTRDFVENAPYEEQIAYCRSQTANENNYSEGLARLRSRPDMEYAGIIEFKNGRIVERFSKAINVAGEIRGRVWFYLDITERKHRENELINRNFELDSFVYRASHDLKAPLNSIMGLISIIQGEREVDSILSYIGMMDKSVKKLDEFIKQLTQFSQDARLKVVRQPIHYLDFLDDVLRDLRYMEHAGRVDFKVNVDQEGEFYSDPIRLGIIFNNLISNAIKYQDPQKETPSLEVSIEANEENAVCRFRDNGLGIDKEHLEKVFDLFFRASVQATGSGLGLYITHNAVQKLGGEIQVESEPGVGTTFILTIPNQKVAEPEHISS